MYDRSLNAAVLHPISLGISGVSFWCLTPFSVCFYCVLQDHEVFKREGDNLRIRRTISLTEALCGELMHSCSAILSYSLPHILAYCLTV